MCVCVSMCVCVCVCLYVCVCVCMSVYLCVYTYSRYGSAKCQHNLGNKRIPSNYEVRYKIAKTEFM